jgi:hypothetical protein
LDLEDYQGDVQKSTRTLLFFPIIHSQSEMGTLAQPIMKDTEKKVNLQSRQDKDTLVNQFWLDVENTIFNVLSLRFERTRVYQDGLPICDKEEDIVADIAGMGSPNFRILLRLKEMGATIMGTESASLLIEEYQHAKLMLKNSEANSSRGNPTIIEKQKELGIIEKQKEVSGLLLEKRDTFIAARISQTLQSGETGILFLGMLHNPVAFLPSDIRVQYPIGKPLED